MEECFKEHHQECFGRGHHTTEKTYQKNARYCVTMCDSLVYWLGHWAYSTVVQASVPFPGRKIGGKKVCIVASCRCTSISISSTYILNQELQLIKRCCCLSTCGVLI